MSDTISLGFKLTGEADFKRALTDINNSLKLNASEMGLVQAKYESNGDSAQKLSNKIRILQDSINNEKTKMSELKDAIASYSSAHTSAITNIDRLKTELAAASNKMSEMKSSSTTTKQELLAQQSVVKDLAKELSTAEKAYESTGKNVTKFSTELNNSEKNLAGMQKQLKATSGEGLTDFGNKAKEAGEKLLLLSAGIIALGAKAVSSASNLNESQNKVEVAFKTSAKSVEDFSKTTLETYGISEGAALDMASLFGDMATSMGVSTSKAASMSTKLVGLAGDLASFKNISIDIAQTALAGIFTGETESLKKLGIVMTEANLKAFALSIGIKKSYSTMSEAEKVNLRYQYILAKTTNSQGDFANTSDGTANSARTLQQSLEQLSASFGEVLLPAITPIIQGLSKFVQGMASLPEPIKVFIAVLAGLIAIAGPLLVAIGQISLGLAALTTGTAAAGISIGALVAPIGIVILAIAAVALAAYTITENWGSITGFFTNLWTGIGDAFNAWGEGMKTDWAKITGFFQDLWQGIGEVFQAGVNVITTLALAPLNAIIALIDGAIDGINAMTQGLNTIKATIPESLGGGTLGFNIATIPPVPFISIPSYATGTLNHPGGRALVGENGPEIVDLPSGSKVYPNGTAGGNSYTFTGPIVIDATNVKEFNDIIKMAKQKGQRMVQGAS